MHSRWIDRDDLLGAFLRAPVDVAETAASHKRVTRFPSMIRVETRGQPLFYEQMVKSVLATHDTVRLSPVPDPIAGTSDVDPDGAPGLAEAVELAGIGRRRDQFIRQADDLRLRLEAAYRGSSAG